MSAAALQTIDLTAGYGSNADVLGGVSVTVAEGEAIAILGANGAGKTTLLKTICGLLRARSGSVRLAGNEIVGKPAHRIARAGLAHVPEGRQIFVRQSVAENLRLGAMSSPAWQERQARLLDVFPVLQEKLSQNAGELSGGQQQMLAIARGLMSSPSVLMIDEPSLGLSPKLVDDLTALLGRVRAELNVAVVLVEQNAAVAAGVADRAYVLRLGSVVLEERAENVLGSQDVLRAYLA
jgi:branched-chain amino acid transport system ATP-binding protein